MAAAPARGPTAMSWALSLLARQARSEQEMRQRLVPRFGPQPSEEAITRLKELGYLDDESLARSWIAGRRGKRAAGPRRLRSELAAKGVRPEIIQAAVAGISEADQLAQAKAVALDLLAKARGDQSPARVRQRVYAALLRRGFDHERAATALAQAQRDRGGPPDDDPELGFLDI